MNQHTEDLIIGIPTSLLSLLSLISAFYICISAYFLGQLRKQRSLRGSIMSGPDNGYDSEIYFEKPQLITHNIFWMSFCDAWIAIWHLIMFVPKIFDSFDIIGNNESICYALGVMIQLSTIGSVLWYLTIAVCLFSTLFGCDRNTRDFDRQSRFHSIFVWFFTIIAAIIPLIASLSLLRHLKRTNAQTNKNIANNTTSATVEYVGI